MTNKNLELDKLRARCAELEAELERATTLGAACVALGAERTRERDEARLLVRSEQTDAVEAERDRLAAQLAERDGQVAALREALEACSSGNRTKEAYELRDRVLADTATAANEYRQRVRAEAFEEAARLIYEKDLRTDRLEPLLEDMRQAAAEQP